MKTKLLLLLSMFFGLMMNAQGVTLTGNGTGGWNPVGAVVLTSTDNVTYTASNFPIIGDGEMKFSEGTTWADVAGFDPALPTANTATGFPSGTAKVGGGSNIKGSLGWWNVSYNKTTKAYAFTPGVNPYARIFVSGTGLPTDLELVTLNGSVYSRKGFALTAGTYSFKQTTPTAKQWGGSFPLADPFSNPATLNTTITIPQGIYGVVFSPPTATGPGGYEFKNTIVSMIGNFVGSGWGADLDLTTTDGFNFTKTNWQPTSVTSTGNPSGDPELHMKFRDDHDWAGQFGNGTNTNGGNNLALTGTAINGANGGGGDIFIPWPATGTGYNVNFNRSTGTWTFTVTTLSNDTFAAKNFSVYPNPSTNVWNLSSNNVVIDSVQIYDALGKQVYNKNIASNESQIDATNFAKGIYIAKINGGNTSETIKLVRN